MRTLSLTTKLGIAFAGITFAVFAIVGGVLYRAMAAQIEAQDDLDIVLSLRHMRGLATEIGTVDGIQAHEARLDTIVLGNPAFLMRVVDNRGWMLTEHNPSHIAIPTLPVVGASDRITDGAIQQWREPGGAPVRGIAAAVPLHDGSRLVIIVAREMSDRVALLSQYRLTIAATIVSGMLVAIALGYLLIRASLRPVREIAKSAAGVTVHRLDTRIDMSRVPPELGGLALSLNAMLARIETGFQRLSQFVADLAHDLRTPVANMRGASEVVLARPRLPDEYQALIASNLEECERVQRMIENVLFLARADHPQFITNAIEFQVRDELERVAEYFEGLSEDAGVTVKVDAGGSLKADVELFRRAVSNLLANALRYTPRGGVITLGVQQHHDQVRVTVANPGPPIPPEHVDKVFDRFYRADMSRSNPAGSTGLGLAIVRTIMELHQGSASVESGPYGTRFHLIFKRN
jgi:two-component system heavy metal sensor histidine kinase CusS